MICFACAFLLTCVYAFFIQSKGTNAGNAGLENVQEDNIASIQDEEDESIDAYNDKDSIGANDKTDVSNNEGSSHEISDKDELAEKDYEPITVPDEVRGVWFSYHEWIDAPVEEEKFVSFANEVMDNVVDLNMNTIYIHVRADSDAMYPSDIFPWSKYITGTQGEDPGYDPFLYMIEAAHSRGIRVHAWINPYRITHKDNLWEEVCSDNPARKVLSDNDDLNDRMVLFHEANYYYNPANEDARKLIVSGVEEILEKYDIEGIHLDDYFYPTINDSDSATWFDYPEYEEYEGDLDITEFRRENVNTLIKALYSTVKEKDERLEFGISPAGNMDNLYSNRQYFCDVKRWMSEEGFLDYIVPQLFWGFEAKTKNGQTAPWAYENNLNRWTDVSLAQGVSLYIGLPMYLAGRDIYDNNAVSEWLRFDDIVSRQVECARAKENVSGFVFYAYSSFNLPESQKERENLMRVFE